MFFINPHDELKNIDNNFNLRNDIKHIKEMYVEINNEKYSYYHLCKKYIMFKNKNNLLFFLKFDIKKSLNCFEYYLNIYYLYDKLVCNQKDCIKYFCNDRHHYNISKSKLVKVLKFSILDKLIEIFPNKIQDITKCVECNNIWEIESNIRYFEKDKKYDFSKCDSCKFNDFIRKKTLKTFDKCSICLNEIYEDDLKTTKCNHNFHLECIETWLVSNRKCPLCREKLIDYIEPEFMI